MLAETMHAHADDDARLDSGANPSIMVVPRLHLRLKTPTPEERSKVHALQMIIKQSAFWEHAPHQTWLTDTTLLRFLIAPLFPLCDAATKTIVTSGAELAEEARRRKG
ncbi:hypothetical protein NSK_008484 [Nannochloropsis salina CCMP1776]|uniref:Uncharacterized protein n=1 Tax=Nannochloropsis salina CCMP1776 TaxID=1027361 RepID=A0A4D9CQ44_9STRA|nr:hypothetical protein NSK_008484 [Nannochloropsis salina CCMP1776]|eukprot:TFJ80177.1 hypothetical protein NSK_008484 [Nannochloropsis salina CCMP1776]